MTVKFYINRSDNNVVDKDIDLRATLTGTLKEATDVVNPTIMFEGDIVTYSQYNYVYIEEFSRYYYILGFVSIRNGLFEVDLHCDVLMTYKNTIRQQSGIVARQQNNYNLYLSDDRLKLNANPIVYQTLFPNAFTQSTSYVMSILGNSETVSQQLNETLDNVIDIEVVNEALDELEKEQD